MKYKKSTDLYKLIKALSGSEKRYFKLYTAQHARKGRKIYLHLFDLLEHQEKYDPSEIEDDKLFKSEQIPNLKSYLYKLILKSLQAFRSESSPLRELKETLLHVESLFEKALYEQCKQLLGKAKKQAYRYEIYPALLEIINWEKAIISSEIESGKVTQHEQDVNALHRETKEACERILNSNDYWVLGKQLYLLSIKDDVLRSHEDRVKYEAIISNPLFSRKNLPESYIGRVYYYQSYGLYYRAMGNLAESYKWYKKVVEWTEVNPHQKMHNYLSLYIPALTTFIRICGELRKYDEVIDTLKKLRAIPARSILLRLRIFIFSFPNELAMYIEKGEFEHGLARANEDLPMFESLSVKVEKVYRLITWFNIAYLHFGCRKYSDASRWLNRILNETEADFREDLQCFARIFSLVVHFELGNQDLLEYIVKSTYRFLLKRNKLYKVETAVLDFIRKRVPKISSEKELLASFKDLKAELTRITSDPFEKKAMEYFDVISWLESKIEKKSFAEIMKRKAAA